MTAYLDTHVLVWLLEGDFKKISEAALRALDTATLLVSPMVLLEVEYLYEIKRTYLSASDLQVQMQEADVHVCDFAFPRIVRAAVQEKWTRDTFDRLITAHARANGQATLITADTRIRLHYPNALW